MALTESGGNFKKIGTSGERGALQYMPDTWKCISMEVMGGEVLPHNPNNEWYVSVLKVNQLLQDNPNYSAYEIGMIWNGTLCGSEKPIAKRKEIKGRVIFDTVAHANKVLKNYYQLQAQE